MLTPLAIRGKLTRRHDLCNNALSGSKGLLWWSGENPVLLENSLEPQPCCPARVEILTASNPLLLGGPVWACRWSAPGTSARRSRHRKQVKLSGTAAGVVAQASSLQNNYWYT